MKSGLFDCEGKEIKLGDIYVNPTFVGDQEYEVYFVNGAFCGGKSEKNSIPLGWEYNDEEEELERIDPAEYIKVIKSV